MQIPTWPAKFALIVFSFAVAAVSLRAQSPVTVQADLAHPGRMVPADFCGLSYELKMVLPNAATGKHYFRPDNAPLVAAFETLGIRHLRVGGNTAERATVSIPDHADIDSLFAFAKAAGLKVIYTVRMEGNTPEAAAAVAKYVTDHYGDRLSCLTVGNEPDKTLKYPVYLAEWKKFTTAILKEVPDAKFCGPSTTPQGVKYSHLFANDMGGWEHLAYLTQHDYPRRSGEKVTNEAQAAEGRAGLLSPDMYQVYQKFHDVFVSDVKAKGAGYRLEETNSYSRGGAVGVSDTFTASLWIVDYLYWWAWHDALGINFHTGEKVMRGQPGPDRPNVYTALTSSPQGIKVLPTGYGMKLFNLGSQGRLVPVDVVSNPDHVNLAAYGTVAPDKTLCLTVLNKEYGPAGRAAKLTIHAGPPAARGEIIFMSAPNGDITTINGVTIGGAEIKDDGSWEGKWSPLPAASKDGSVTVVLPAASAAVIKLHD
ncbi:MAG TPA: hypothetical protein VMI53_06350 [Opitutaceae bacterium]|nr:hypothetical protein [Opitutaceae bacterium]